MSANCMVEVTKCVISLLFLMKQWNTIGVTDDNTLMTTLKEIWVYPVPALLYLIKVSAAIGPAQFLQPSAPPSLY